MNGISPAWTQRRSRARAVPLGTMNFGSRTDEETSIKIIHEALEAGINFIDTAGVEDGDEVIVPVLTFVTTATSVALVKAIPIFADVDPETYNISPQAIKDALTERTKEGLVNGNS